MRFLSLFSGIGGFDLGFERAGMECVGQVEIDAFCLSVLNKHWPNVPKWEDVRDVGKHNLPNPIDLICGGFPCQDVSLAGKRTGLEGKRSTLWSEFYRIICEIEPRWVVVENVPGLLSSDNGRFFGNILRDLAAGGYDAEWDCIPAAAIGADHVRDRLYLVAYPAGHGLSQGAQFVRLLSAAPRYNRGTWNGRNVDKPGIERMADGIPDQLERLKALGNAVVPQVAEWLGRRIVEVSR